MGIHALVWVGSWGEADARRAMEGTCGGGYDRPEIPLLDSWDIEVPMTRRLLEEHGLAMTPNQFLTAGTDITSEDREVVSAGEQRLTAAVDLVGDLGGDYLCGTIYSKLGKYEAPPRAEGRANCAGVLRWVVEHAAGSGVRLGLELCNKFETNPLNAASQALDLMEMIDHPNVFVHLDAYHMTIEKPYMMCPARPRPI